MPNWERIATMLAEGWNLASANPLLFLVLAVLLIYVTWRATSDYYKSHYQGRLDTHKGHIDSKDATIELLEKRLDGLRTEADGYRAELSKYQTSQPPALLPVSYGNEAIKDAFVQMTDTTGPLVLLTVPTSIKKIEEYAAFMRLQEVGLAKITQTAPTVSNVTSTSTAMELKTYSPTVKKSS